MNQKPYVHEPEALCTWTRSPVYMNQSPMYMNQKPYVHEPETLCTWTSTWTRSPMYMNQKPYVHEPEPYVHEPEALCTWTTAVCTWTRSPMYMNQKPYVHEPEALCTCENQSPECAYDHTTAVHNTAQNTYANLPSSVADPGLSWGGVRFLAQKAWWPFFSRLTL